jgi:hypothetical protein
MRSGLSCSAFSIAGADVSASTGPAVVGLPQFPAGSCLGNCLWNAAERVERCKVWGGNSHQCHQCFDLPSAATYHNAAVHCRSAKRLWTDRTIHSSAGRGSAKNCLLADPKPWQDCSCVFFGWVLLPGIRVVLGFATRNSTLSFARRITAYYYEHSSIAGGRGHK